MRPERATWRHPGQFARRARVASRIILTLALASGPPLACSRSGPRPTPPAAPVPDSSPQPEAGPELPPPTEPPADSAAVIVPVDTAPAVAVEPPRGRSELRVCAGGDVLLGNNLDTLWAERAAARLGRPVAPFPDPDSLLAPLRFLAADADLLLLNIEGAIGEGPAPAKCRPESSRCYAFRQPVAAAAALGDLAESVPLVANLANNHAMDAGFGGYTATVRHLLTTGVHVTGRDTSATPVILNEGRDTLAILGFSVFRAGPDPRDLAAVRRHVARAAELYDRVVVTMHMGAEGRDAQRTPNASEYFAGEDRGNSVAFARTAVESGASLVIGHGPHVLRAAEWWSDALILYSLGNLATYGPFNLSEPLNRGAIACAMVGSDGAVRGAALRSTVLRPPGVVGPDISGRGAQLVDSLSQLDFPSSAARVLPDGTILPRGDASPGGAGDI